MDIINLNGVEYVKRNKITEIEAERDKLQKDLEAIRKIVGVSLKDASEIDKLSMFSYIIVPKKVRLYKEIMRRNKKSKQIIFE